MIKCLKILLLFFILSHYSYAQEISFTGKVIDKQTRLPVKELTLTAYKGKAIIYQSSSDTSGVFKIPFFFLTQSDLIKIHSLNYVDLKIDRSKFIDNVTNKIPFIGIFDMDPKSIVLKEVKIKSKKRYRDTTRIDLSNQKFERSIMIDDLFSKYGFTKDASGQIYYKGRLINDLKVNGDDFFGKNNIDIYHLLPALILNKIEIIETNIDSATNITKLHPTLKVNLIFKEKYEKGKFGNSNLGIGSSQRDLINANLFTYKKKEQISFSLNSNNINSGENNILEPKVDFSATGNNLANNVLKLTYRNIYARKVEIGFSIKGKLQSKTFTTQSDLQELNENLFSKIYNSSDSKSFEINDTRFNVNYKIDTLNEISLIQTFTHLHQKEFDSLSYNIKYDSLITASQLNRLRNSDNSSYSTKLNYQKKYSSLKGRLFNFNLIFDNDNYKTSEIDNVYGQINHNVSSYFINGDRLANEKKITANSNFTEPINDNSYINFFFIYQRDKLNYTSRVSSDTIIKNNDVPFFLTNTYLKPGLNFHRTFEKILFDVALTGIVDSRNMQQLNYNRINSRFFNFNSDVMVDYKINDRKNFLFTYTDITNYPEINQITNLNTTFDIIAQTNGNVDLHPEEKRYVKLTYNTKPLDSESINIVGEFDHYNNKFGFEINSLDNNITQNMTTANVGTANMGQVSFSFLKSFSDNKSLTYTNIITYQQSPTISNNKLIQNNGITFNQSLSISLQVIKPFFSITPIFSPSYSIYYYETSRLNIISLTYSDKLSFSMKNIEINLYPLATYNHSISNNSSLSMNGAIRKSLFKGYGNIWIQAYDIFNSFKYINNFVGPSSYQSIRYSNLNRYILLGLSFKFNTMR